MKWLDWVGALSRPVLLVASFQIGRALAIEGGLNGSLAYLVGFALMLMVINGMMLEMVNNHLRDLRDSQGRMRLDTLTEIRMRLDTLLKRLGDK